MKLIRALIIVLALSLTASAGDMPFGRTGNMENDKAGDMHAGKARGAVDPVTAIALQLLHSVLPLF